MLAQAQAKTSTNSVWTTIRGLLRLPETSIFLVAIVLAVGFELFSIIQLNKEFLNSDVAVLLESTGEVGLIAVGEAMLMITGEIDLSAAYVYTATPWVAFYLSQAGVPYPIGVVVALVAAGLVGFINGFVTVRLGVPSLIATLGMIFVLNGIVQTVTHSETQVTPEVSPFNVWFGRGYQDLSIGGPSTYGTFLWLVAVVIIMTIVLRRTRFGMHTISVGSNLLGAREIGIRTDRVKIMNFVIMGVLAGLGGCLFDVSSGTTDVSANPQTTLYGIAAAVVGGTSLFGGSGTIIGALIGSFVISLLNNGLPFIGAQAGFSDIPLGLAIIVAMVLNIRLNRTQARRS